MSLFHRDIGFPRNVQWPCGLYDLQYGHHAITEARRDRYGDVSKLLPKELNTQAAQVIEAEIEGRRAVKIVYRIRLDEKRDLCLAISTNSRQWFVRTIWINEKTDTHQSLNCSKYERVSA